MTNITKLVKAFLQVAKDSNESDSVVMTALCVLLIQMGIAREIPRTELIENFEAIYREVTSKMQTDNLAKN